MLRPIGPVAVFGASNFPLAFSVAGGDTASALAAGNPVVFKAHPAHPGTSELVGCVIRESVRACGMPEGVFSLLFDAGVQVGAALAQHPAMQAVAFTGSFAGGTALMKLAASRPAPIPCYAEMGSVNPVFILPGALNRRGAAIAGGLQSSFTLGAGQFCTKPGLIFIPREPGTEAFLKEISDKVAATGAQTLLTERMARQFASAVGARLSSGSARLLAKGGEAEGGNGAALAQVSLWLADCEGLSGDGELAKEIFGPTAVLVAYGGKEDLLAAAGRLEGHLTATIHGDEAELAEYSELIEVLARKVGRVLFNSYPTGVEVGYATVHGGPFPATSDGRSTSVGAGAILRFARPVCFQDFPDPALPEALRSANPLGILRLVNGAATRGAA
jgi:NADP-dependent aldehyde dehydrogenase